MSPIILALPGNEYFASLLNQQLDFQMGVLAVRAFPDGESYVRIDSDVKGKDLVLVNTLVDPDKQLMPLLFLAKTAKKLGAKRVGLVAPYLAYMRQDKSFKPGESVSASHFASLLSSFLDWLVTVDPHLHRIHSLEELYPIPTGLVHAAPLIAQWISQNVNQPLVIGPDSESKQWVSEIADLAGLPFTVFKKQRLGDRKVELEIADVSSFSGHTPVLVDDIISTGTTMIKTAQLLEKKFDQQPVCLGIHGIFTGSAYEDLLKAGVRQVVTTNTIIHKSNMIDLSPQLAPTIKALLTNYSVIGNE